MHVLLAAGNNKSKIDQKFTADQRQLTLETFANVYEFLETMAVTTNPWEKVVLMSSALAGKEDEEITEIMEMFRDELLKRPEAIGVFMDKENQYQDYVVGIIRPSRKIAYLNFPKITITTVIDVVTGSIAAPEEEDYQLPPKGMPQIDEPQPPPPPTFEMPPEPEPPAPPAFIPEPPPPPMAPPPPPPPPVVQQVDEDDKYSRMAAEMKKRSRAFIVTGQPRSGISGTVANMAMAAAQFGVNTLIIDMDMIGRGQFAYYPQNFEEYDRKYTHALSNALRSYTAVDSCRWQINNYLDILSMDLCIEDARAQESYADDSKLQALLGYTKVNYDLVLIDMPFTKLSKYPSAIMFSERCAYIMENDVMSLLNFLHMVVPDEFNATVDFQLFESRLAIIVNKYLEEHTYMERTIQSSEIPDLLCDIGDDLVYSDYKVIGSFPYIKKYGLQVDQKPLLAELNEYCKQYFEILYGLYK